MVMTMIIGLLQEKRGESDLAQKDVEELVRLYGKLYAESLRDGDQADQLGPRIQPRVA